MIKELSSLFVFLTSISRVQFQGVLKFKFKFKFKKKNRWSENAAWYWNRMVWLCSL